MSLYIDEEEFRTEFNSGNVDWCWCVLDYWQTKHAEMEKRLREREQQIHRMLDQQATFAREIFDKVGSDTKKISGHQADVWFDEFVVSSEEQHKEGEEMTAQEIFDKVSLALLEQGVPSVNVKGDECRYRGANGTRCGAGWLIDDRYYHPDIEGKTVCNQAVMDALCDSGIPGDLLDLVGSLQHAHDMAHEWSYDAWLSAGDEGEEWSAEFLLELGEQLEGVAGSYQLNTKALAGYPR